MNFKYSFLLMIGFFLYSCSNRDSPANPSKIYPHKKSKIITTSDSLIEVESNLLKDTQQVKQIITERYHLWTKLGKPVLIRFPIPKNDEGIYEKHFFEYYFSIEGILFLIKDTRIKSKIFYQNEFIIISSEKGIPQRIRKNNLNRRGKYQYYIKEYLLSSLKITKILGDLELNLKYNYLDFQETLKCSSNNKIKIFNTPSKEAKKSLYIKKGTLFEFAGVVDYLNQNENYEKWVEIWIKTPNPMDDESWFIPSSVFFQDVKFSW